MSWISSAEIKLGAKRKSSTRMGGKASQAESLPSGPRRETDAIADHKSHVKNTVLSALNTLFQHLTLDKHVDCIAYHSFVSRPVEMTFGLSARVFCVRCSPYSWVIKLRTEVQSTKLGILMFNLVALVNSRFRLIWTCFLQLIPKKSIQQCRPFCAWRSIESIFRVLFKLCVCGEKSRFELGGHQCMGRLSIIRMIEDGLHATLRSLSELVFFLCEALITKDLFCTWRPILLTINNRIRTRIGDSKKEQPPLYFCVDFRSGLAADKKKKNVWLSFGFLLPQTYGLLNVKESESCHRTTEKTPVKMSYLSNHQIAEIAK